MKYFYSLLIVLLIVMVGCKTYTPPKTYNVIKEATYDQSYDEIWSKAIEWFAMQGTPVKNMDKESGFISTEYSLSAARSGCLDCGEAGVNLFATQRLDDQRGNFNILIKKQPDNKIKVTVNAFFQATSNVFMDGRLHSSNTIDCKSTGILEKEILDYLGT